MSVWEYFTQKQQEKLKRKLEKFDKERLKQLRRESNEVLANLIEGFKEGTPPETQEIIALSKQLDDSQAIFNERDPEIEKAIERFHIENPTEKDHGMDLEIYGYIEKAKSYIKPDFDC